MAVHEVLDLRFFCRGRPRYRSLFLVGPCRRRDEYRRHGDLRAGADPAIRRSYPRHQPSPRRLPTAWRDNAVIAGKRRLATSSVRVYPYCPDLSRRRRARAAT
jgi:hypothetical protein